MIHGLPVAMELSFEDGFGVKPLSFMLDGQMYNNHCGGTSFSVYVFHVDVFGMSFARKLTQLCDDSSLWWAAEESFVPRKAQIAVMRYADEFES